MGDSSRVLGNVIDVHQSLAGGVGIEFHLRRAWVSLQPLTSSALRVSLHFEAPRNRLATSDRNYAIVRRPWPGAPFRVEEQADAWLIHAGRITVRAEKSPFRLSYLDRDGRPLLSEVAGGGIRYDYWSVGLHFELPPDEAFYGFGEADQGGVRGNDATPERPAESVVPLNHRGLNLPIWHWHQPPSRVIQPLLLSSRHYGLLIDNPVKASWDLGAGDPNEFSYVAEGGQVNFVVFAADSLLELLTVYTQLTGRSALPPLWSLGYMQSRYGYRDAEELVALARRLREHEIPCDGLILDLHWFDQMGDLAFSRARWPDPRAMIEKLKEDGFHLTLIEEPYLTEHSRLYPEARERGLLARRPDGEPYLFDSWPGRLALVDFTDPAARAWWAGQHKPLVDMGVEGHWIDLVEPMDHPIDMLHREGPAILVHNTFADQIVSSVVDAWQECAPDRRPFLMTRAGFAGLQRTGFSLWSGDVDVSWEALATQVAIAQNAGLAGFANWNSDTGGFSRKGLRAEEVSYNEQFDEMLDAPEEAELYLRWLQFSAFCPVCRVHGDQFRRREPWVFGPEIETFARKVLLLRYRLIPYLYSCFYENYRSGVPIVRPLLLYYEDDPVTRTLTDEYLFGRQLLVAPVLAPGARRRRVYLPAGVWYDAWTEKRYEGPAWVEVDAPLDHIPLFAPAGALLPFGPEEQWTGRRPLDPLTIHYYAGAEGAFDLYEDDGATTAHRRGEFTLTAIRVARTHEEGWRLTVDAGGGQPAEAVGRAVNFWLHGIGHVLGLQRDERPLPALASRDALRRIRSGWWHDTDRGLVGVKIPAVAGPIVLDIWARQEPEPEE